MDQILPPVLNDFEFAAMRQLAAHPATCHIPSAIKTRLKDIGYAKEVLGHAVLTDDGLQRIAQLTPQSRPRHSTTQVPIVSTSVIVLSSSSRHFRIEKMTS